VLFLPGSIKMPTDLFSVRKAPNFHPKPSKMAGSRVVNWSAVCGLVGLFWYGMYHFLWRGLLGQSIQPHSTA
jgi:hypothetical protein